MITSARCAPAATPTTPGDRHADRLGRHRQDGLGNHAAAAGQRPCRDSLEPQRGAGAALAGRGCDLGRQPPGAGPGLRHRDHHPHRRGRHRRRLRRRRWPALGAAGGPALHRHEHGAAGQAAGAGRAGGRGWRALFGVPGGRQCRPGSRRQAAGLRGWCGRRPGARTRTARPAVPARRARGRAGRRRDDEAGHQPAADGLLADAVGSAVTAAAAGPGPGARG